MNQKRNDISDLLQSTAQRGGAMSLPIRSEKTIFVNTNAVEVNDDFHITAAALKPYSEYLTIRLPGRGGETPGVFNANTATYRFLINPSEARIQRQTIDAQAFARSGWQIGVWGEDFIEITLTGKTPGKYFDNGLTDLFTGYTQTYRNLMALELVVENNGYWFEGEQIASNLSSAPQFNMASQFHQQPRRIKMHQDMELRVGEFIWSGLFEAMDITEDAENPFLVDYSLTFIAWREEFVRNTPYKNLIGGQVERGHVPIAGVTSVQPLAQTPTVDTDLTQFITEPNTANWTIS